MRRLVVLAFLALAPFGCSNPTESAGPLDGNWVAMQMVPGAAFELDLQQNNMQVRGGGHYSIEAGPAGRLAVSGSVQGGQVALRIMYDRGWVGTFSGALDASGHLSGTLQVLSASPSPITLERRN